MKKIGIVTPFRIANYGTKLQAYALETYLNNKYDVAAEIICYQPNYDKRISTILRKLFSVERNIGRIKNFIYRYKIKSITKSDVLSIRNTAINSFNSNLLFSKRVNSYAELKKFSKNYDCIICGSDQIWIPDNIYYGYYTLAFVSKNIYKGSYAASLGINSLTKKQKKQYKKFISELDFISVREESGRELLKEFYTEKTVTWVCDPTFLIESSEWRKFENRPEILKNVCSEYIFCYFIGGNEVHRKIVYEYARENNLKILTIANFRTYCRFDTELTDIQLYNLSVNEFLYLIDNAKLVCTDSMHATIFSTILETNFWTFERFNNSDKDSRNSRIYSLLNVLGLTDRLVKDNGKIGSTCIDFTQVEKKKKAYIDISQKFIDSFIMQNGTN